MKFKPAIFLLLSFFVSPVFSASPLLSDDAISLDEFMSSDRSSNFKQYFYNQSFELFDNKDNLFISSFGRELKPRFYAPSSLIEEANQVFRESDAFKKRSLYAGMLKSMNENNRDVSLDSMTDTPLYFELPIIGSFPFDFERMSKTVVLNKFNSDRDYWGPRESFICYEKDIEGSHFIYRFPQYHTKPEANLYGVSHIKLSKEFKGVAGKVDDYCAIELKFGEDIDTAKKVEAAFSNLVVSAKAVVSVGERHRFQPDLQLNGIVFYSHDEKTGSAETLYELDATGTYANDSFIEKVSNEVSKVKSDHLSSMGRNSHKLSSEEFEKRSASLTKKLPEILNPKYAFKSSGMGYDFYLQLNKSGDGYELSIVGDYLISTYVGAFKGDHYIFTLDKVKDRNVNSMSYYDSQNGAEIYPNIVLFAYPFISRPKDVLVTAVLINKDLSLTEKLIDFSKAYNFEQ